MSTASFSVTASMLQQEFREELIAIADWWVAHAIDHGQGGFYGEIDANNTPSKNANKGIILNTRILWFFSAVAQEAANPVYRDTAVRAYNYLVSYFIDTECGGVYWELDVSGHPLNTRKQVYAQAFAIYALSAYYQLTQDQQALSHALNFFELLETRAVDREHEGYLEAFARDWSPVEDMRLSTLDLNYPKSQNTHLHILEAYTALHEVHPIPAIKKALRYNIELFDRHMINKENHHLRMFMAMDWKDFSPGITYGHDIEASWLIGRALTSLNDKDRTTALMPALVNIAAATLREAMGAQGQIIHSYDYDTNTVDRSGVWWVQAEALVGFLHAFAATHDAGFFLAAEHVWKFIKQHQKDKNNGEWFWLADSTASTSAQHYKAGFWKCPYHNGRAMIEASKYLAQFDKH